MSDLELQKRVVRFERTVAVCLCAVPTLFAGQCLVACLAMPVFQEMLGGFGAALPAVTTFVFGARLLWILLSLVLPAASLLLAIRGRPTHAVIFATVSGLSLFFIAQFVTIAAFLPVFDMANAVGGNP